MYTTSYPVSGPRDAQFLSHTFAFFALALLFTGVGTWLGFWLFGTHPVVFTNPLIFYGAIILQLVLVFTSHSWSERLPFGYGMFGLFTLLSGFSLVPLLAIAGATGGASLVARAFFSATAVFAAAALFGWVTHLSLQGMRGFLMLSLVGLIVMSILSIFFPWGSTMEIVVSGAAILIFAGFTMVDVQQLTRQQTGNALLAAISLYLNFINLFVSMLRLFLALGSRD